MKYSVKSTIVSSLLFGGLLMIAASSVHAAKKDVEAGPIWNQADANNKCQALARKHSSRWTGQWRTTVPGKMSVCELEKSTPAPMQFSGYYKLQTMFLMSQNKCLEGNRVAPNSTLKGASFMDSCQNVSGQFWKFVPAGNGWYKMKTMFLENQNKCFEGASGSTTQGIGAFMDNCQNVSGQLWKAVPAGNGYFRLKNMFLESKNKCLEGNRFAPGSTLKGAAFMDTCQNVSGQLWKFTKVR